MGAERGQDIEGDIIRSRWKSDAPVRSARFQCGTPVAVRPMRRHWPAQPPRLHCLRRCRQVAKTETYQVKIPAGVTEGQRLRITGAVKPAWAAARPATFTCACDWPDIPISRWKIII